ncbi:trypsin-1-like isoform X2 [Panulirus ornatus]
MQRSGTHLCAGSVLNENFVITAGHCVDGHSQSSITVVAGEYDLEVSSGDEQRRKVSALLLHEHYDDSTNTNDIALVKLAEPLVFNDVVKPIELPGQMELVAANTLCTTTGWGSTFEDGDVVDVLRKVDVPVVSDNKCRESYGVTVIADHMLCAGYEEGGKDACQGDSGGPFVCLGKLHGITSAGYGCARPNYPGVYTEVAYFREWIDSHMADFEAHSI